MKRQSFLKLFAALALGITSAVGFMNLSASAQGPIDTSFSYQGRLRLINGAYVSNTCDFQFSLWDAPTGGTQVGGVLERNNIAITDGYFSVSLDFGDVFPGDERYLQIAVSCPESGSSYDTLAGRVEIDSVPYALTSQDAAGGRVAWDGITGKPAGFADDVDDVVTYSNGFGLNLDTDNQFSVITETFINTDTFQQRVIGDCSGEQTIQAINPDGSVRCVTARTDYQAGEGIDEAVDPVTQYHIFEYDADVVQERVSFFCGSGRAIRRINPNGSVFCEAVPPGDVTYVEAESGLTGGGSTGIITVTVDTEGITSSKIMTDAVSSDKIADSAITAVKIMTDAVAGTSKIANETILFADIGSTDCGDGHMLVYSATTWQCAPDQPGELVPGLGINEIPEDKIISVKIQPDGGLTTANGPLQVSFSGTGDTNLPARSDHTHNSTYVQPTDPYSKDVSGSFNTGFTVIGIRGIPVPTPPTSPSRDQILTFDESAGDAGEWVFTDYGFPFDVDVNEHGTTWRDEDTGQTYAQCSSGETLVGGGCRCHAENELEDSYPDGNKWRCDCENSSSDNYAYARCIQSSYP